MDVKREDFVVKSIQMWNRTFSTDIFNLKCDLMKESTIEFFKGTNILFWSDMERDSEVMTYSNENTRTFILGNCHFDSFRIQGNPEESPCLAVVDFDEACLSDYQFDIWRLAVSFVLLAKNNLEGDGNENSTSVVEILATSYLKSVLKYGQDLGDQPDRRGLFSLPWKQKRKPTLIDSFLAKIERENTEKRFLKKWTAKECSSFQKVDSQGRVEPCSRLEVETISAAFSHSTLIEKSHSASSPVTVKDVVRKVPQDASAFGIPQYYVLVETENGKTEVLDVRMQKKPTPYFAMSLSDQHEFEVLFKSDGQRWNEARELFSVEEDPLNGWFYIQRSVHPLWNGCYSYQRISVYDEAFPSWNRNSFGKLQEFCPTSLEKLMEVAQIWGQTLATFHCLANSRFYPDEVKNGQPRLVQAVTELVGKDEEGFVSLVCTLSHAYAEEVVKDWNIFKRHFGTSQST